MREFKIEEIFKELIQIKLYHLSSSTNQQGILVLLTLHMP